MNKLVLLLFIPFFTFAQQWDFVGNYDSDGRHHPVTFSNDDFGFVLAGQNNAGEYLSDVLRYDVQSNSWEQLANFPGGPRGYAYGVSDGTNAYVGFGSNNDLYPTDWWVYSIPNNSWEELQSFPYLGRNHPAMVLSDLKRHLGSVVQFSIRC
jgi:N-acetylneuraminic acid mutarotase